MLTHSFDGYLSKFCLRLNREFVDFFYSAEGIGCVLITTLTSTRKYQISNRRNALGRKSFPGNWYLLIFFTMLFPKSSIAPSDSKIDWISKNISKFSSYRQKKFSHHDLSSPFFILLINHKIHFFERIYRKNNMALCRIVLIYIYRGAFNWYLFNFKCSRAQTKTILLSKGHIHK